ncbi:UvrB/UvrC motif-containing protein [Lacipirellula sp.]|uniref:UvrB/UvrC motif-containing protein n=1 Tax=Lacipirellula sp. TaxID=2691419 RepID=UPI003D0AD321
MPRSSRSNNIDRLLRDWAFEPGRPVVRRVVGEDGRELLQMRVDMGLLQLETTARPDGATPEGFPTYYDYLVSAAFQEGTEFALNAERQQEIDREFVQFYHRRICWLSLNEYERAAEDADHSLKLMDFSTANSEDRDWAMLHEQYRPFVLFHKVQATALTKLQDDEPEAAVEVIGAGLQSLAAIFARHGAEEHYEEDLFVVKLREMQESIKSQFHLGPTLAEQLADAIATEQYELAAKLRDRLARKAQRN